MQLVPDLLKSRAISPDTTVRSYVVEQYQLQCQSLLKVGDTSCSFRVYYNFKIVLLNYKFSFAPLEL